MKDAISKIDVEYLSESWTDLFFIYSLHVPIIYAMEWPSRSCLAPQPAPDVGEIFQDLLTKQAMINRRF